MEHPYRIENLSKAAIDIKTKRTAFTDRYAKSKEFVPPPNKYIGQEEWCIREAKMRPKGAFLKEIRLTETERQIKYQKKFNFPSSHHYKNLESFQET